MANIFDEMANALPSKSINEVKPIKQASNEAPQINNPHEAFPLEIKLVTQELIKFGAIEAVRKNTSFVICSQNKATINKILFPLDLELTIDDIRGLAFLVVIRQDDLEHNDAWQHPLVRRQRMNLEQSLMTAILRQFFLAHEQESGVGEIKAIVHLDDLLSQLNQYLGASGSESHDEKRLRNLLEQLRNYALVSEIDANDKITIRPLIVHLLNPEHLQNLMTVLQQQSTDEKIK